MFDGCINPGDVEASDYLTDGPDGKIKMKYNLIKRKCLIFEIQIGLQRRSVTIVEYNTNYTYVPSWDDFDIFDSNID